MPRGQSDDNLPLHQPNPDTLATQDQLSIASDTAVRAGASERAVHAFPPQLIMTALPVQAE
jgi:hypothetical protein